MPKVIQVSTYFHPAVGGVERQAEEIAAHLVRRGYAVEVFASNADHGKSRVKANSSEIYRGFKVRRFTPLLKLGYFFQTAPGLIWAAITTRFDVLHLHNVHDGHLLLLLLVCAFKRKKFVVTGHNPYVVGVDKRGKLLNSMVNFHDWVVSWFSWGIGAYVALLDSEKEEVQRRLRIPAHKVHVIPNGIEDKYYEQKGDRQKFFASWEIQPQDWTLIVGAACRMNYVKGIQHLVPVAKALPQVLFIFAGGDDGYLDELQHLFASYPNVIFTTEYLKGKEMLNFYSAIDLFLLPSVYEPFGMTVVEAMAQSKVVIATNNGGPPDIIPQSAGKTLDPTDTKEWINAIQGYINQPRLLKDSGENAQKAAQRYRWAAIISELEQVYN